MKREKRLRAEWHPDNKRRLSEFSSGSSFSALWRCSEGHEWRAAINNRTRGTDCPYCANRRITKGNSLQALYPDIAAEWHPSNPQNTDEIGAGSATRALWRCSKGHEWKTSVVQRTGRGSMCPYCAGKKASPENNLLVRNPKLAKLWHPTRNGKLQPEELLPMSRKRVWWLLPDGAEWRAPVHKASERFTRKSRRARSRTPGKHQERHRLNKARSQLVHEWHPTRNGNRSPDEFSVGSNYRPWWICPKGHEWQSTISYRAHNPSCPGCSKEESAAERLRRGNIAKTRPELVAEWHPHKNKNRKPEEFLPSSRFEAWWICPKGHEWQTKIRNRKKGGHCPKCARNKANANNNLRARFPRIAAEWHPHKNGAWTPEDFSWGSNKPAWWLCPKGHEWRATPNNRTRGSSCPECTPHGGYRSHLPGYLYLLHSKENSCWQVGITNFPAKRLQTHLRHGDFRAVEVWHFAKGEDARRAEDMVLRFWRKNKLEASDLSEQEMPQGGWTETVKADKIPKFSLARWTRRGKRLSDKEVNKLYKKEALART